MAEYRTETKVERKTTTTVVITADDLRRAFDLPGDAEILVETIVHGALDLTFFNIMAKYVRQVEERE